VRCCESLVPHRERRTYEHHGDIRTMCAEAADRLADRPGDGAESEMPFDQSGQVADWGTA